MRQLLSVMDHNTSAELYTDDLVLSFNAPNPVVTVYAHNPGYAFAAKVMPKQITYCAVRKMLRKEFDHVHPYDITNLDSPL